MIAQNISQLIGNTPLMELCNYNKNRNLKTRILAKLEAFNPAGSSKDRVALAMIKKAKEEGLLKNYSTIIEPTSGNTGIGLASIGTSLGYKVILTMPDTMSVERQNLLKAYGATIVLTPGAEGMKGAIEKAENIAKETPNSFIPSQFTNQANPDSHYNSTGPEIWKDTDGNVDIFVASIGTGGTISGTAKFLKEKNPNLQVIGVEPADSPLLSKGKSGPHKLQGIGANFIPETLDKSIYNKIITVTTEDAYSCCNAMAKEEGFLVGISSGATLWAATEIAKNKDNINKTIVALLPDSGERYLSTGIFQ